MIKKCIFFLCCLGLCYSGFSQQLATQAQTSADRSEAIKVFPNPATNVINVLGLKNSAKAIISITDIYGTVQQQHQWEIRNNALNIPIPTLKRGIYFVSVSSQEQRIRKKFYKN